MLGLGLGVDRASFVGGFDADYQAVLDRGTTLGYALPTGNALSGGDTLVKSLKSAGIWNKLDIFYVFATNGDSDFATLNWKTPASFQATKVNSPTFTSLQGFTGDGVSASINTNFTPSTDATNYQTNDASRFFYMNVRGNNNTIDSNSSPIFNNSLAGAVNKIAWKINTGSNLPASTSGGVVNDNLYLITTDGNRTRIYEGGALIENEVITPTGLPAATQQLFHIPAVGLYWSGGLACYGMAANLDAEQANLNTAITTYLTSI